MGVESLFLRLIERELSSDDLELLGKFRQAYQQLRETIKKNKALEWDWSKHSDYLAFKNLGAKVAFLVLTDNYRKSSNSADAMRALQRITDNRWEHEWSENEPKGT